MICVSQRLARAASFVQATGLRAKGPTKLQQSCDSEKEKEKNLLKHRYFTHTVNVTSVILSKEERKEWYCGVMLLSLMTGTTVKRCPAISLEGRNKNCNKQKKTKKTKQCSSPRVSSWKWCNATLQCTPHCCSRVRTLKMYSLTEFDTLAVPKNSIQRSFLKSESPTCTLILECRCLFQSSFF